MKGSISLNELPSYLEVGVGYPITGQSGASLIFYCTEKELEIVDVDNSTYILSGVVDGSNNIEWTIATRNRLGKHHPDMYAAEFYDGAYKYFVSMCGCIHGMISWWIDGTNYEQYMSNIKVGVKPEEAAIRTWSGKQASMYGFNKSIRMPSNEGIIYHFIRS